MFVVPPTMLHRPTHRLLPASRSASPNRMTIIKVLTHHQVDGLLQACSPRLPRRVASQFHKTERHGLLWPNNTTITAVEEPRMKKIWLFPFRSRSCWLKITFLIKRLLLAFSSDWATPMLRLRTMAERFLMLCDEHDLI